MEWGTKVSGVLDVESANGTTFKYIGQFLNEKFNGQGSLEFKNGSKYVGEFKQGLMTGKGKYVFSNGAVDEGNFVNGRLDGIGIRKFPSGGSKEGNFVVGKLEGIGKEITPQGGVFEGKFINDQSNGHGIFYGKNGSITVGEYVQGKLIGKYKTTYANGDSLEANGTGGKLDGFAVYTKFNGDKWYQEWKDGVKVSETPAASNSRNSTTQTLPSNDQSNNRQKGVDSLYCESYANNTPNPPPAIAYGDRSGAMSGISALLSAGLMNLNRQEAYDSCMQRLGYK